MIKNLFFFKGNRHYLAFISFERLGFISGTPSVRSRADRGARIFPSVNICHAIWVPEHLACHSSSVSVCRSHRQQNASSSFLSDSGFILIQTLPCRSPWWPVTCVARRLVGRPWKRVNLTWPHQLNQPVLNSGEKITRKSLSFIFTQIKMESWRLAFNPLIL